jgi:GNAT superfamily N-acetyltransferase
VTVAGAEPVIRPAHPDELEACAAVFRSALNGYLVPLGQAEVPEDSQRVVRLFAHLRAGDPERFLVATVPADGREVDAPVGIDGDRIVAFAAAYVRDHVWFLSMLFVLPDFQAAGLGRRLFRAAEGPEPSPIRAVGTDSAQPISNALYARLGLVPRMPLFELTGLPQRPEAFGALPSGIVPLRFDDIAADRADGQGHRMLVETIESIDRELVGFAHPTDHRFLRGEDRHGWLYRGPDGSPLGYGYAGEAGRIGPVAALDAALVAPIIGHLSRAVVPRGAFALWVGGHSDRALVATLEAGFRLDPFPVLLGWDRSFADFERYLPASPGLL